MGLIRVKRMKIKKTLRKIQKLFKDHTIKFFLVLAGIGLIIGVFGNLKFAGTSDKTVKMGNFTFSEFNVGKTMLVLHTFHPKMKKKELRNQTVVWMMYEKVYDKKAAKDNIQISNQEAANFIRKIKMFKGKNGFDKRKYDDYLKENSIRPIFFEKLVKNEIIINLYKSIVSKNDFKNFEDIKYINNSLNDEWDIKYLIFDISNIRDYQYKEKKIIPFYENDSNYLNLKVGVEEYYLDKNVLKKIKQDALIKKKNINAILTGYGILPDKKYKDSVKKLKNKIPDINLAKNIYFNKGIFYEIKFPNEAKEIHNKAIKDFQEKQKMNFVKNYINNLLSQGKDFKNISSTQNYIENGNVKINYTKVFINKRINKKIKNSNKGDVNYFISNEKIIVVKTMDVKEGSDNNVESIIEKNYINNMEGTFLNILDDEVTKNY